MTLENEFEYFKALHKYAILYAKVYAYYRDLEKNKTQIPDFMRIGQRPEDLTNRDLKNLLCTPDGLKKFDELYELAYKELAEVLD